MPDLNRTQPADPVRPDSGTDPAARTPDGTQVGSADDHRRTAALANSESAGRYRLREEIARGGMGAVYRATDTVLNREVAVKVLQDRFGAGSAAARRFDDEARITGQLQHPGIPPVHDLGALPDGRPFLAMKLIKGDTLEALLGQQGADAPRSPGHAPNLLAIFEAICQAVAYAHVHSVIHRDLKPSNVMVGAFGEVQVMDWGLAKLMRNAECGIRNGDEDPDRTALLIPHSEIRIPHSSETQAGSVLGTPAFMPPEQATGAVDRTGRPSDVFGLGAILCAILTGQPPYVGPPSTVRAMAEMGMTEDAIARLRASRADPELVELTIRCLAKRPDGRPADAGEVAKAVAALRQAADERARHAEVDRAAAEARVKEEAKTRRMSEAKVAEERKRRKVQLALAGAVGLLLLGGGAFAWWQDKQATARQTEAANRARDERERRDRNGDALAALVGQCEKVLTAGDEEAAGAALVEIVRRLPEGGGEALAGRIAHCRTDLALLAELNQIDKFAWTPVDNQFPNPLIVTAKRRELFARFGIEPGSAPEAANRIGQSLIRDRLLTALDLWLLFDPSYGVRALLAAADPDPYRDQIRDAVLAKDNPRVAELTDQADALAQPPGFAAALGRIGNIPLARRRVVLEVALPARPGDLTLLMTLGVSYPIDQREGAEERVRWFQAAVAAHPRNAAAHNNLGLALDSKGDVDGAVACYREALKHDPKFAFAHSNLGLALASKGDVGGAVIALREAIKLDPKSAAVHSNLGYVLASKGDVDGAVACYREALKHDPKSAFAHTNLGFALASKGDVDGAVACYREALKHDPKFALAHTNLGIALRAKGDVDGAIAAHREALKHDPKFAKAYNNLGNALREKGDLDEAVVALREAIRLDPKYALAHNGLGAILCDVKKDYDGAVACFREAIRLDPKYASAHTNLGVALVGKGDLDGAIECFREAARLDPKNPNRQKILDRALKLKAERDEKDGRIAPPPREVKR